MVDKLRSIPLPRALATTDAIEALLRDVIEATITPAIEKIVPRFDLTIQTWRRPSRKLNWREEFTNAAAKESPLILHLFNKVSEWNTPMSATHLPPFRVNGKVYYADEEKEERFVEAIWTQSEKVNSDLSPMTPASPLSSPSSADRIGVIILCTFLHRVALIELAIRAFPNSLPPRNQCYPASWGSSFSACEAARP